MTTSPIPPLFVSFWHIDLYNLPLGTITKTSIAPGAARTLITEARAAGELLCVAQDDLAAPWREAKRAKRKHVELCEALELTHDIKLGIEDFFGRHCVNILQAAHLFDGARILVVNCAYVWPEKAPEENAKKADSGAVEDIVESLRIRMYVAPDSIEFLLFESDAQREARDIEE